MENLVKTVLDRPFASMMIVGAITGGIANIIRAVRGVQPSPSVQIGVTETSAE
jgi:hypothetical protein